MLYVNDSHIRAAGATDVLDALTAHAYTLLTSTRRADSTPAVRLARSVHTASPTSPAAIRAHLDDVPHVLAALARHAQAGDRHALLMAAVLMRDRLRVIARHAGDDGYLPCGTEERTEETLAVFFALLRTAAEPETLTERFYSQPGPTAPPAPRQRPRRGCAGRSLTHPSSTSPAPSPTFGTRAPPPKFSSWRAPTTSSPRSNTRP